MNLLKAQRYLQNRAIEVLDLYDVQTKHYSWRTADNKLVGQAIINHSYFQVSIYHSKGLVKTFFGEDAKELVSSFEPKPAERTLFARSELATCHELITRITNGDQQVGLILAMMHPKTSICVPLKKMFSH